MTRVYTSAAQIAKAVRSRQTSAFAVVRATLERIADENGRCNAFTEITEARALAEARMVDAAIAQGRDPGPLAGVPFTIKDLTPKAMRAARPNRIGNSSARRTSPGRSWSPDRRGVNGRSASP